MQWRNGDYALEGAMKAKMQHPYIHLGASFDILKELEAARYY
jgi:hypothetical protein